MPNYYRISDPSDLRDIHQSIILKWAEANNPKLTEWIPAPVKPTDSAVWNAGHWIIPAPPATTAEDHLAAEGYTPIRLLTCLDIEGKLNAAGKASPKLSAVRQWLDSITVYVASNPVESRYDWGAAPFQFDQVLSEALTIINS